MYRYLVVIEKTETGYSAYFPDIPGCVATAKTKKSVEKRIYEAAQFHLEGLRSIGERFPTAHSLSEVMVFQ
ncbi:type II toxin-antitoxin system HicB family antitoxin [bacterium]|nr:type II toxin-antitoxin system HicB family antitoxin [bacterium]